MANKARIVGGQAVDVTPADEVEQRFHPDIAAEFETVPDEVSNGWRLVNGQWQAPPPPPEPGPEPKPAPVAYYLSKVLFERRLRNTSPAAWTAFDVLRVQVQQRPADWPTSTNAAVKALRPFVPAVLDYIAADQVNVADPAMRLTLETMQAAQKVFGDDAAIAAEAIDMILTPGSLAGEPAA